MVFMREARKPILGNTQMVGEHHEATKVGIQREFSATKLGISVDFM
jgi:hypothetical protein